MDDTAKDPNSDADWQAIDIFVFSNGQQYSPPRKYHLQMEDMNLWKSTLSFLAKTQYGPFHSTIDLYTIQGRKIGDPLQLSNGGSYVAVQPPDSFIEAGYDKYLIKASRSWEKRRSKRSESALEPDDTKNIPKMESIDDNVENGNTNTTDETVILKSRVSSLANHNVSTIIKPQLVLSPQRRSEALNAAKPKERKKASVLSPIVGRKITPSTLPAYQPSLRNSYSKKRDSVIKTTKPEERKQLASSSGSSGTNNAKLPPRLSKAMRFTAKSREPNARSEVVLAKVPEGTPELKTLSSTKVDKTNNDMFSSNKEYLKNLIGDKELVADLYQNPNRELPSIFENPVPQTSMNNNNISSKIPSLSENISPQIIYKSIPSITINPIPIQSFSIEPPRQHGTTKILEDSNRKSEDTMELMNSDFKITIVENKDNKNTSDHIENSSVDRTVAKNDDKIEIEKYPNNHLTQTVEENTNIFSNEVKLNVSKGNDYANTAYSQPKRLSVKVDLPENPNKENNVAKRENLSNDITVSTCKSSETIKILSYLSPPRSSITTNRVDSQHDPRKMEETQKIARNVGNPLIDGYKATLRKGDVLNFKLNIEIESNNGSLTKQNDNFNCQSIAIIHRDKGSQSNIDDQIIAQNKSLLSLITRDIKSHNAGDNNHVIIVHYNTCKYCKEYNAANPNNEMNKNFLILLPIEKFEELKERCHCNEIQPEIQMSSASNPVKQTYSCMSLPRLTKTQQSSTDTAPQNLAPDRKSNENFVTVTRKKSVAIHEETMLNTHEQSRTLQEMEVKTELITISVESIGMARKTAMKNTSTQTEWCDLLLEAKLLSDGHYTFRLPPLELLKRYKLT